MQENGRVRKGTSTFREFNTDTCAISFHGINVNKTDFFLSLTVALFTKGKR